MKRIIWEEGFICADKIVAVTSWGRIDRTSTPYKYVGQTLIYVAGVKEPFRLPFVSTKEVEHFLFVSDKVEFKFPKEEK